MSDTKETIQTRLLASIDDVYDKTEGSFIYDIEMPVAIELETAYAEQNKILDKVFADTSTGTYLERKVADYDITRKAATYATTTVTVTGIVGATIKIGDKVATDSINFIFTEGKTIGSTGIVTATVQCEIPGTIGNVAIGTIKYFPITLQGLITVTNTAAVTNGYAAESDNDLRQRYYAKVRTPATSGNKYHYLNWAKEVTGVGDAKVIPLWNGNGTIKVIIINSNRRAASADLINTVAEYIEKERPIGATVTVVSGIEKPINITATIKIDGYKYTIGDIKAAIESTLIEYYKTIAFVDEYVSYAKIGNILLGIPGVFDYSYLMINGSTSNVALSNAEIPVLGNMSFQHVY